MYDPMTGHDLNIQGLLRMAEYAEEAEKADRIDMERWFTGLEANEDGSFRQGCGTAGCLVGTYVLNELRGHIPAAVKQWPMPPLHPIFSTAYWGMSENFWGFLFTSLYDALAEWQSAKRQHPIKNLLTRNTKSSPASSLSGREAIDRLRKATYYKARKAEILADDRFRQVGHVDMQDVLEKELSDVQEEDSHSQEHVSQTPCALWGEDGPVYRTTERSTREVALPKVLEEVLSRELAV